MSISNECMIVNLRSGLWAGHRLDKAATQKITQDSNADADAARVNKHLIPKDALSDVVTAQGALRQHFYYNTLPWKDNGDRLLTRQTYARFINEHTELVQKFNEAVDDFLENRYAAARAQAEFRMGDLFKPDDYPSTSELRHRFYVTLDIDAVAETGDFRVTMSESAAKQIRQDMEANLTSRVGRAMQDIWTRLAETLHHFTARMEGDTTFRDTTVTNLEEIVAILPELNMTNDPNLAAICDDIKGALVGYSPSELRRDSHVRSAAAVEARRIMDNMAGFMTAFKGDNNE